MKVYLTQYTEDRDNEIAEANDDESIDCVWLLNEFDFDFSDMPKVVQIVINKKLEMKYAIDFCNKTFAKGTQVIMPTFDLDITVPHRPLLDKFLEALKNDQKPIVSRLCNLLKLTRWPQETVYYNDKYTIDFADRANIKLTIL